MFGKTNSLVIDYETYYDYSGGYITDIEIFETDDLELQHNEGDSDNSYTRERTMETIRNDEKEFCKFLMKIETSVILMFIDNPIRYENLDKTTKKFLEHFKQVMFVDNKYPELFI